MSEKNLSSVGREVLLNLVALAIPTYAMSRFKLSVKTCKKIKKNMCLIIGGEVVVLTPKFTGNNGLIVPVQNSKGATTFVISKVLTLQGYGSKGGGY